MNRLLLFVFITYPFLLKAQERSLPTDTVSIEWFAITSPRLPSEFYVTYIASDGYKVVFCWNELYNTVVGNSVLIVTEEANINAQQLPEHITLLSTADNAAGRRYIKGLQEIIIERIK
ncbi:MAG: hypothetical protein EAZ16_00640 [Sphingobacteriales bacterium]|nr:MAG: hypothetical protein EAZ16_00640 [Sphingobacteriales bacterium]